MEKVFEIIAVVLSAYIIGSIPTGYIIVKSFTGQDRAASFKRFRKTQTFRG